MNTGNDRLWNIISIVFLVLTVIVILFVAFKLVAGKSSDDEAIIPELLVVPSATLTPIPPTPTATSTPTATYTPTQTDTPSATPSVPPTLRPSDTPPPSPTITATLSATPTLDVTATETPEPSPTGPTPTPAPAMPFVGPAEPQFTANFANSAGCSWQGIGGQVTALDGSAFNSQLQVHVYSPQQDFGRTLTGTNSAYGVSGFEVRVGNIISRQTYFVQLESRAGTPVSEIIQITFPGTCEQNAAIINFQQTRSLGAP